jgi:NAD(P)-dependent dehydrogenase (short-subunit alcohol dehydrogenase family)
VTGGAVRLGRAIALALADAGVDIGLHYFYSDDAADETCAAIRARGTRAVSIQADLTDAVKSAQHIVAETTAAFGGIDILINSAAIFVAETLQAMTAESWQQTMSINLQAPTFLCQEFSAQLSPDQSAQIVNIVDWRATRTDPGHLVYTLSKSGLVSLTRNLAVELAPRVQVNAVAPGAILPPPGEDESYLHKVAQNIPLQRAGSPADVTDAVLYLLRSDFVTGEVLYVAGGQEI